MLETPDPAPYSPQHDLPNANGTMQYSLYGHVQQLAEAQAEGIKRAGGEATIYQ